MITNSNKFDKVSGARPPRSVFDLSHSRIMSADMGYLYPVLNLPLIPGDKIRLSHELILRMMPLVSPVLHEINVFVHTFFVPYRILWDGWEEYITGGKDGDDASVLPTWSPQTGKMDDGSLWDYLGFPTLAAVPTGALPMEFPKVAYNRIWNTWYRDNSLQTEVEERYVDAGHPGNEDLLQRSWQKDYFTSAQPNQQRGTPVALPISGIIHPSWETSAFVNSAGATNVQASNSVNDPRVYIQTYPNAVANYEAFLESAHVDLSNASTFDVADLRLAFQIQKLMERNQRCGVRYTEWLMGNYNVAPTDARLQLPEYIGGIKAPVIISEVLQTSESATTPQGTLAGHGITVATDFAGSYEAQEFGVLMSLLSIMPKPMYQQGIPRHWLYSTRYDFPNPIFANLSEQAITRREIYTDDNSTNNNTIFGYQGMYDELRYLPNTVHGLMRDDLSFWHLGRIFGSAPALNDAFLKCNPDKRIFAVTSEPGFVVNIGNLIKAVRPIPIASNPGLIDHS